MRRHGIVYSLDTGRLMGGPYISVFQESLLTLQKPERMAALDTLAKLRRLTWSQAPE